MIQQVEHTDEKREIKPIDPPPEPEYEFFDPERLTVFRHPNGRVRATVEDDKSFLDVRAVRCFPQTDPDRFWALIDRKSLVIGIIADPATLEEESRLACEDALGLQYFMPVVTAVRSLKEEYGAVYFEVETDRGPRAFVAKGIRDCVEQKDDGEIMLADVDENRYLIPDWNLLDQKSRRLLEQII